MSDRRLRELRRGYLSGDPELQRAYVIEALRQGVYSAGRVFVLKLLGEPSIVEVEGMHEESPSSLFGGIVQVVHLESQVLGASGIQFMKRMLLACADSASSLVEFFWTATVETVPLNHLEFGLDTPEDIVRAARRAARPGQPVFSHFDIDEIRQRYLSDRLRLLGEDIGDTIIQDPKIEACRVEYATAFMAVRRPLMWLTHCGRDVYEVLRGEEVRLDAFQRFLRNAFDSYDVEGEFCEEDAVERVLEPMRRTLVPWLLELK